MGISQGNTSLTLGEIIDSVSESQILAHYLGITSVPIVINSPLRQDNNPSFGIFSPDGKKIRYRDFATGDSGSLFDLLGLLWKKPFQEVLNKIVQDKNRHKNVSTSIDITREHTHSTFYSGNTELEVRFREWRDYDLSYWSQFGIEKSLLTIANVHPISHYFIIKDSRRMTFGADKYAYAYVEFKEGNISIKVYQPFNKSIHKWISKHDKSVLGLWTLMPRKGKIVCICSSVKDALCLMSSTHIPSICLQGEAYMISNTAQKVLKERFEYVCILLDSDKYGREDAARLSKATGFINIELPESNDYKDIAEYYTYLKDPQLFKTNIINLFKNKIV